MYLKRLDIQGFKTFASRTALEFRPGITAVVGPNGSGKCVSPDTLVTLADGRELPIRDLVDQALSRSSCAEMLDDGWLTRENPDGLQVLSLDPATFQIQPRPVVGFVKREAPEQMLHIRTRSGREITVTPYHPLFTLDAGELRALRADELREGMRVALPRRLPITPVKHQLEPLALARLVTEEDRVYVPNSPDLYDWAGRCRDQFGSYVAWRQQAFVSDTLQRGNPNLDLIPGVTPLVRQAIRLAGVSVKRHRAGRAKLSAYAEGRCEVSRTGLLEVCGQIEGLGATPERARPLLDHLRTLASSDVYWDEIVAVEARPPADPWVYDLSVAETHNFVANNVVVHNSNLADAVRWVLGEQSFAALRCRRAEELIYSGGGRRAPAGFAEVSLTIDNADRLLPLDFDEVTITRRSTRAGDSDYFINRARVRLRDVLEATEPLGGSYTIINQGLVDAALTLRPEERRRLFEDAAEIGGFELRKAEAMRRLRETEGNLQRVGDLLAELEPRLRALKRQAGQARQHRELTDELRRLQRRYYALQWREARALTTRTQLEAARTEQILDQARAAQAAVGADLHALRAALRGRREALGLLHQRSSDLHRRAEQAQRELAVGTERLAALARRAEEQERRRNELELRRQEVDVQRAAAAAEAERAAAALDSGRAELRQAEAELSGREAARRALAQELRAAQDAAVRAAAAVAEQASRAEQLTAQRARLTREGAELALAVTQAEDRVRSAQAQAEASRDELAQAEAQRQSAAAAEQAARAELERLRAARAVAEEERGAARRALADIEARLDSLSRLARSYAGTFAGVRAAMQWAERAGRPGFALVQSIIRTPAAIETAIETALGSRLQNIVVERWEDAEAAIDELKRGGAGRATFMPLDSLKNPEPRAQNPESRVFGEEGSRFSVLSSDPVLGVAADLVEYDDRYEPVARQLLGRVLVVRDLPTARAELRRLQGGWTIVTLAGEQVNSGGSVTGGAQAKESGALRRERELRELPGQVGQSRAALDRVEARRGELESQAQQLGQRLRELEVAARDSARQLESRRAAVEATARRVAQAEQENQWAIQRRERLERDLAALDGQEREIAARREEAAQSQAAAERRLAEQRARQEAEALADRAAQERLAGLRATAGAMEGQLRAQRSLLSAHEQGLAQAERQIAESLAAVDELAAERARFDAAHAAAEATHRTLLAEIDALRAQIDPAEAELQGEEARQAALEQREQRATAALLDAESVHTRAALDAQRAADRQEALFERAVADGVDVTAIDEINDQGPATDDQGPTTDDQGSMGHDPRLTTDEPRPATDEPRPATHDQANPDALGAVAGTLGPSSVVFRPAEASSTIDSSPAELQSQIDSLKTRILRLGAVNPLALEEYDEAFERQKFLGGQVTDLRQAGATLLELIAELDQQMGARFARTFQAVAAEFERSFTQLFGGGSAKLLLTGAGEQNGAEEHGAAEEHHDSLRGQGIEILVRPPGKKQQNISLLSGGERTLTAAALLFAILKVNPSPFCILDETDAALDESNVGRFREALQRLTEQTQFILITHNRGTIEAADTLYGVTMGDDGASKTISLRVEEYVTAP